MRQNPQEKNVSPRTRSVRVDQFRKFMQKQRRTIVRPPWLVNRPLSNPIVLVLRAAGATPNPMPFLPYLHHHTHQRTRGRGQQSIGPTKIPIDTKHRPLIHGPRSKNLWPTAAGFSEAWPNVKWRNGWLRAGSKNLKKTRTTVGTGLPPCCRGRVDGKRYLCLQHGQDPGVKQRVATVQRRKQVQEQWDAF
jgi:hypothetical protein